MSDNQNLVTELSKTAVELAKPALQPLAKRAGKVGDTAGGIVEMVISPLTALVWSYDKIKAWLPKKLEEKLANIPEENIIQPPNYAAIPTLQKLVYTDNEELQEMFTNLLANSMDIQTKDKAHPSFVEIISQLNPDEAKLLKYLSHQAVLPKIDILLQNKDYSKGYRVISNNCSLFGNKAELDDPTNARVYFNNFERLGLLNINSSRGLNQAHYVNEDSYSQLIKKLKEETENYIYDKDHWKIEFAKGFFEFNDFGKQFLNAVTKKIN